MSAITTSDINWGGAIGAAYIKIEIARITRETSIAVVKSGAKVFTNVINFLL